MDHDVKRSEPELLVMYLKSRGYLIAELSDVNQVEKTILSLTSDELKEAWTCVCGMSQTFFAKAWKINRGNFSSWLKGKKKGLASVVAVQRYLCGLLNDECAPFVPSTNIIHPTVKIEGMTQRQLLEKVTSQVHDIKAIFFIDADNSMNVVRSISDRYGPHDRPKAHFVINLTRNAKSECLIGLKDRSYCSLIFSSNISRDACDLDIAVESSMLNMIIPTEVKFILVSRDEFVKELEAKLNEACSRNCRSFISPSDLTSYLKTIEAD